MPVGSLVSVAIAVCVVAVGALRGLSLMSGGHAPQSFAGFARAQRKIRKWAASAKSAKFASLVDTLHGGLTCLRAPSKLSFGPEASFHRPARRAHGPPDSAGDTAAPPAGASPAAGGAPPPHRGRALEHAPFSTPHWRRSCEVASHLFERRPVQVLGMQAEVCQTRASIPAQ